MNAFEVVFIVFAAAFTLEEYTASKEHGWGSEYLPCTSTCTRGLTARSAPVYMANVSSMHRLVGVSHSYSRCGMSSTLPSSWYSSRTSDSESRASCPAMVGDDTTRSSFRLIGMYSGRIRDELRHPGLWRMHPIPSVRPNSSSLLQSWLKSERSLAFFAVSNNVVVLYGGFRWYHPCADAYNQSASRYDKRFHLFHRYRGHMLLWPTLHKVREYTLRLCV